jgi:phosphoribosyl-AMP cyclohydrolase
MSAATIDDRSSYRYSSGPLIFREITMSGAPVRFQDRKSIEQVEEGNDLAPKFDDRGLITVVTTDADSGELLMQGYMNTEALRLTITTGEAHYYSRSRQVLWHKGATSGLVQTVRELLVDDDQDCIWLRVDVPGNQVVSWNSNGPKQRRCLTRKRSTATRRILRFCRSQLASDCNS